jgi:glutathione synthase/RimK-type ligase-like ATP-grasp enzyme
MSGRPAMADATILLIVGGDQPEHITEQKGKFTLRGSTDLHLLLGRNEPLHRLHVTSNFFRQRRRPELSSYSCLLNMITEPEHNSRVLDNLRKLLRDLPGKVINRPEAVLRSTRDQVARQLSGIPGLCAPRTIRLKTIKPTIALQTIRKAGLQFPVILRQAGTHTGKIVGLFNDLNEMEAALAGGNDHIATEFVDFKSGDGFYRKYRVFFIGHNIIFRHMLMSDEWNVHARDRKRFMAERPELVAEEERMFAAPDGAFAPDVREVLKAVRERIALDFFGMDFGIAADGRVVLFEANAAMNFFPFLVDPQFAYVQRCIVPAQQAFRELLGLEPAPATAFPSETDLEPA